MLYCYLYNSSGQMFIIVGKFAKSMMQTNIWNGFKFVVEETFKRMNGSTRPSVHPNSRVPIWGAIDVYEDVAQCEGIVE